MRVGGLRFGLGGLGFRAQEGFLLVLYAFKGCMAVPLLIVEFLCGVMGS